MKDSESHLPKLPDCLPGSEDSEDPAQSFRLGAALPDNCITRKLKEA